MVCSKFKYFLYIVLLRYNWYTINWIYLKCSMWSILTYQWNSTTIKITNIFIAFRSFSHSFPTHYTSVISWSDFFSFSMIILIVSILLHVSMFLFLLLSSFPLCESTHIYNLFIIGRHSYCAWKKMKVKVIQSCLTLCDLMDLYSPWNSPGKNTEVGSLSLLQGIFPTQGLNPGLPHCRQIIYQLSHQESPRILECVAYPFSSASSWPRNRTGVSCIAGGFFTSWATWEAQCIVPSFWLLKIDLPVLYKYL